jgi:hypothetical protein
MFFTSGLNRELFFLTEKLQTRGRKDRERRGPHGPKRIWMALPSRDGKSSQCGG